MVDLTFYLSIYSIPLNPAYFNVCFPSFSHYSHERRQRRLYMFLTSTVLYKLYNADYKISILTLENVNIH
jgi:hypothetical protein